MYNSHTFAKCLMNRFGDFMQNLSMYGNMNIILKLFMEVYFVLFIDIYAKQQY